MTKKGKYIVGGLIIVVIAIVCAVLFHGDSRAVVGSIYPDEPTGFTNVAVAGYLTVGDTFSSTGTSTFNAVISSNITSTGFLATTSANSETLPASLLSFTSIIYTPGQTTTPTLTLPASSTLTSFIPNVGNQTTVYFYNASTAATTTILAAGTGMNLTTASSSSGVINVYAKKIASLEFLRLPNSDISLFVTPGI